MQVSQSINFFPSRNEKKKTKKATKATTKSVEQKKMENRLRGIEIFWGQIVYKYLMHIWMVCPNSYIKSRTDQTHSRLNCAADAASHRHTDNEIEIFHADYHDYY